MNFELGSFVEWKQTKGYIRFISEEYISICINASKDDIMDCCVLCFRTYWNEIKVRKEIPPVFPIMNPARSNQSIATCIK